jgi:hypothetical protein
VEWVRKQAKLFILISFAFIATLFLIPNFGAYQGLINQRSQNKQRDNVVAEVGPHEVSYNDFDLRVRQLSDNFQYSMQENYGITMQIGPLDRLDRQWRAVKEILSQHVLDDIARERNIKISSQEVNEVYQQQKQTAHPELMDRPENLSLLQRAYFWKEDRRIRQEFEEDLRRRFGMTPNQFKDMIRDQLLRQRILEEFREQATDEVKQAAEDLLEGFRSSFLDGKPLEELVEEHNAENEEYTQQLAEEEKTPDGSRITLSPEYMEEQDIRRGDISITEKVVEDKAFELEPGDISEVLETEDNLYLVHVLDRVVPGPDHEKYDEVRQNLIEKKQQELDSENKEPEEAAATTDEESNIQIEEENADADAGESAEADEATGEDQAEPEVSVTDEEVLEELRAKYTIVQIERVKLPIPDSGARLSYLINTELEAREPEIHNKLVKAYDLYQEDQRDEAVTMLDQYLDEFPTANQARWFRGYLYQEMYEESLADEADAGTETAEESETGDATEEPGEAAEAEDQSDSIDANEPGQMDEQVPDASPEADMTAGDEDIASETEEQQITEEAPPTRSEAEMNEQPSGEGTAADGQEEQVDTAEFPSTGVPEFDEDLKPFWEDAWEYRLVNSEEIPGNRNLYEKSLDDYKVVLTGINPELTGEEKELALLEANTLDPFYNYYLGSLYDSAEQDRSAYMHFRLSAIYQGDNFNLISDLRRAFNGLGAEKDVAYEDQAFQTLNQKVTQHQQAQAAARAGEGGGPAVNLGSGGGPRGTGENVRSVPVTPAPSAEGEAPAESSEEE